MYATLINPYSKPRNKLTQAPLTLSLQYTCNIEDETNDAALSGKRGE